MWKPSDLALWLLTATARVASAQPLDERVDPTLPDYILKTAPIGDGRILVLGGSVVATGWPSIAQHTQRAVLAGATLPDVGEAFDITAGDGTAWVLGRTGVAVATSGGSWRQIAIAQRDAVHQHVVALDATHALVLRAGAVDKIDAAAGTIASVVDVPTAVFEYAVSDGSGGAWTTIASSRSSTIGYAHFAHGTWTLWPLPKEQGGDLAAAGFHVAAPLAHNVLPYGEIVSDGHGGWIAPEISDVVHVAGDGAATVLPIAVPYGRFAFAWHPAHDHLVMLALPEKRRRDPSYLVELDHDGVEVSREVIPTPDWYREVSVPPFSPALSQDAATTWISFGTMLFAHEGASWRVTYAATVRDRARQLRDTSHRAERDALHSSLAYGFGITGGSILAGTLGATAIHGDPRASVAMLGGTIGAAAPQLLIDLMLPGPWNDDHGSSAPGMPQLASEVAGGVHWFGFVGGVAGATILAGGGAWEAGRLADRSAPPDSALYGALGGAAVGTAAAVVVTSWMYSRWPERGWLRDLVGSTLIGATASLGYQLGGGGR